MSYFHGVHTSEVETGLITPVQLENDLPIVIGTAPLHLAKTPAKPNEPVLCYQYSEFATQFGVSDDFDKYTLNEAATAQFALFNVSPIVFVNVLNPDEHYKENEAEFGGITSTNATIEGDVLLDTLEIVSTDTQVITLTGSTDYDITTDPVTSDVTVSIITGAAIPADDVTIHWTNGGLNLESDVAVVDLPVTLPSSVTNIYVTAEIPVTNILIADEDYSASYNSKNQVIITLLNATKVCNDTIQASWRELDPTQVTNADIIGGYDPITGKNSGLECIEDVFPKYGLVASIICIPKYSCSPTVAAVMKAKTSNVNGLWRAVALVDIPTEQVTVYSQAAQWKNQHNLVDPNLITCWPKVALEDQQYYLSTQLMALMQATDSRYNDLPYKAPSNENLACDALVLSDGTEVLLAHNQANYLNSQGIYTGLNFVGGYKGWGDRTSAYPSSTDPKDVFIPIRRMFNFINNYLILTFWQKVDDPMNLNLVESVIDSLNIWGNGLAAEQAVLGFRVEISEDENPTTDLLAGIIKFHVYISPPPPAENIEFILEYDPSYLSTLFG